MDGFNSVGFSVGVRTKIINWPPRGSCVGRQLDEQGNHFYISQINILFALNCSSMCVLNDSQNTMTIFFLIHTVLLSLASHNAKGHAMAMIEYIMDTFL